MTIENLSRYLLRFFSETQIEAIQKSDKSAKSSFEDAELSSASFLKKGSRSVVVYGIGLGYHFDVLRTWLTSSPRHYLLFVEEELASLKPFLQESRAKSVLTHPQVGIVLASESDASRPFYAQLTNDFYFIASPQYKEKAESIYQSVLQEVYRVHAYLSDLWLYSEQVHFYGHLAALDDYQEARDFKVPNAPWVIAGAGPSLEEMRPHLEAMRKSAFFLPVGTAMNIFNQWQVPADMGVAFDSKPSGTRRLQSVNAFMTPYFVDIDATARGVYYLHGPKLLTKKKPLEPWKEKLLQAIGVSQLLLEIPHSMSSTHYALQLALQLKVPSIRLLGVDLAYKGGQHYAGRSNWLQDADIKTPLELRKDVFEAYGKNQEKVLTSRTFYQEAVLYTALAKEHPEIGFFKKDIQGACDRESLSEKIRALPFFKVPLNLIRSTLEAWREAIKAEVNPLLSGYFQRLDLLFLPKRKYLKSMAGILPAEELLLEEQAMKSAYKNLAKEVVRLHLEAIEESLAEIQEKEASKAKIMPALQDGVEHYYYENGAIKAEVPYTDGICKLYYDNGVLKSEIAFEKGKRHGPFCFYSRSGKLLEKGHYHKGFPEGLFQRWDRKGLLIEQVNVSSWESEAERIKQALDGLLKEL